MTLFIGVGFKITDNLSEIVIKRCDLFFKIFKEYFFVLVGCFDKFFYDKIEVCRNFKCLFFVELFMFVDKGLKILKPFLQFGYDKFWLVEVKELLNFENVIWMIRYVKRLFEFTLLTNFTIFFTVLHRAYEQYVWILMFWTD